MKTLRHLFQGVTILIYHLYVKSGNLDLSLSLYASHQDVVCVINNVSKGGLFHFSSPYIENG